MIEIKFTGSVEEVSGEMQKFAQLIGHKPPSAPWVGGNPPALSLPAQRKVAELAPPPPPPPPEPTNVVEAPAPVAKGEIISGEPGPQKLEESACQFCVKYTGKGGRLAQHERHCKSNPNRIPHHMDGKRPPWLKGRGKKDPSSSQGLSSQTSRNSWPNEIVTDDADGEPMNEETMSMSEISSAEEPF